MLNLVLHLPKQHTSRPPKEDVQQIFALQAHSILCSWVAAGKSSQNVLNIYLECNVIREVTPSNYMPWSSKLFVHGVFDHLRSTPELQLAI